MGLLPYYNNLHAEYLTSYTKLIGYQYFNQCKIPQIPPTHNLHPHMLPHGTSTGEEYYCIGEQKSLLLRQISLRPYGV